MTPVKNIIFDLGGVLLNLDYDKTTNAFKRLGVENFDELFSQFKANDLFEKLETGRISEIFFYETMHDYSGKRLTNKQIETAWNAMLLDFRLESLNFLNSIKDKYNIYLLSNTNSIHYEAFKKILQKQTGKDSINGYFIKAYYSHLIHLRKPYPQAYQYVLNDAALVAEETLFIDDSFNNIETARQLGINTHLLLKEERIETLGL
ncbi:HAD family hydrolase [Ferruginibacter albus]|uniref:HAD family hydrolase n=1 Tax=Ferruginibacter albus TaxID=2875540 RepID=UPI001CC5D014|nr:HAD family phosphatase [Ferruginibacter albus]UAY52035.1 HAD family phosphatase [Ferruginibacter albus]